MVLKFVDEQYEKVVAGGGGFEGGFENPIEDIFGSLMTVLAEWMMYAIYSELLILSTATAMGKFVGFPLLVTFSLLYCMESC